ncbi:MAG: TonB family protein [Ignavibacteriaceae bacterium]|jgi:TonB family protein
MRKILFLIIVFLIHFQACKTGNTKNTKNDSKKIENRKTEYWANYDDGLDIKSEAIVDTLLFRQEINKILPPDKLLDLFGSGYHNLYLGLTISQESEVQFTLGTDISFWLNPDAEIRNLIFKDGIESTHNYLINYSAGEYEKNKKVNHALFQAPFSSDYKIFTAKPGILNGKTVRSIKLYEINSIVTKYGKIVKPWSINEMDISKYREHFISPNVNRYYFMTGLPAVSVDGFESIRKALAYPETALKNGITGRVIVQLFVDGNGDLDGYQILKGLGYGCDDAVINAIIQAKFKGYPTGQRSSIIVPFEFGPPQTTPVDLAVQLFDYIPDTSVYNNIRLGIVNKNMLDKNLDQKYFIYVYIDNHCFFQTCCSVISKNSQQGFYWFRWRPNHPGSYNYTIYIDPENRLNDSNRENNTVKGTFVVR